MDIEVQGLRLAVPIGYYTQETDVLQTVTVSFGFRVRVAEQGVIRRLRQTVSYEPFVERVLTYLRTRRFALLEEVATTLRAAFLAQLEDHPLRKYVESFWIEVVKEPLLGEGIPGGGRARVRLTTSLA